MNSNDNRPDDAIDLRRQAEKIVREKAALSPENLEALSLEKMRAVLYELREY